MAKRKTENTGTNAVVYARYSSHSQRDVSIEQQVQKCTEHLSPAQIDAAIAAKKEDPNEEVSYMTRGGYIVVDF